MKNYVVIPTYKEAENLRELLPLLKDFNVIIVDDNSNDGTAQICGGFKNVKLIVRKNERGLASAVLSGVKTITDKQAKVVVMDADFQHDPKKLPEFFRSLDEYGFAYGSRKTLKMPFYRKVISKTAESIVKVLIPKIREIDDPMSGYFGFRLDRVNLKGIKPIGYKIMLAFIMNLDKGAKIKKIEYEFGERKFGSSKLSFNVMLDLLRQVLRLNDYRIITFGLVGLSGVFVNEGVAFLLHAYLPLYIVFIISAETSILTNFILNHNFTFKRRVRLTKALPRYNLVALAGLSINVSVALYLSLFIEYLLANFIGIIIAFVFNYVLSEIFAWKNSTI